MCGDMLWLDKIQQLVEKGILAANRRCQAHSLVQFKSERVPTVGRAWFRLAACLKRLRT